MMPDPSTPLGRALILGNALLSAAAFVTALRMLWRRRK
jgi:hypothetical protein